jgi:hypothetical protein
MDKEIRFKCSEAQFAAIQVMADRKGLTIGAYTRMVALEDASKNGVSFTQPVVD